MCEIRETKYTRAKTDIIVWEGGRAEVNQHTKDNGQVNEMIEQRTEEQREVEDGNGMDKGNDKRKGNQGRKRETEREGMENVRGKSHEYINEGKVKRISVWN